MANNFDQFPIYDTLVKKDTFQMAPIWVDFITTFYGNLVAYLTEGGILLPQLTTQQRDQLINVQLGQMIYNTTLGSAQYYKAGVWTSF